MNDLFKWLHKQKLPAWAWALDNDLILIEKFPIPFKVAILDLKMPGETPTFTEAIAYQQDIDAPIPFYVPVYFIIANDFFQQGEITQEWHRFTIWQLMSADYRPDPPDVKADKVASDLDWDGYSRWETKLRADRQAQMKKWMNQGPWGHYVSIGEYLTSIDKIAQP